MPDIEEYPYPWLESQAHRAPEVLKRGFEATDECRARIVTLPPQARVNVNAIRNAPVFADRRFHGMDIYEAQRRAGAQIESNPDVKPVRGKK